MVKRRMSDEQLESAKSWLYRAASEGQRKNRGNGRSIRVPKEALPEIYRSRTRVQIEKAKEHLGYEPKFDFERGMNLTTQYIRWANLG